MNESVPSDIVRRYGVVADGFGRRVRQVTPGKWNADTPCDGWTSRDIIGHLVDWVPAFVESGSGIELSSGPDVADDPAGAWAVLDQELRAVLADPDLAARPFSHPMAGDHRLDDAIARFVLGDVLIHTWDLARATGLDEALDPDEVAAMLAGVEPLGDVLEKSGHYAARVAVGSDADAQTRLLAAVGRRV
jgi:uncharacterized protein (TIGR03086 family)